VLLFAICHLIFAISKPTHNSTKGEQMHNTETKKTVIRMRAEGHSIRTIAEELKIAPSTVFEWNKEFATEISEKHRHELESVLEDLHVSRVQRVRALGRMFKKIELHLQNSDNVHKDYKLFTLLLRIDKYITQELLHELPPVAPKHVCPDPVINFITDMPMPTPYKPEHQPDGDTAEGAPGDHAQNQARHPAHSDETNSTIGHAHTTQHRAPNNAPAQADSSPQSNPKATPVNKTVSNAATPRREITFTVKRTGDVPNSQTSNTIKPVPLQKSKM
jgi:hypothetical protein